MREAAPRRFVRECLVETGSARLAVPVLIFESTNARPFAVILTDFEPLSKVEYGHDIVEGGVVESE